MPNAEQDETYRALEARLDKLADKDCRWVCVWLAASSREHQEALMAALDAAGTDRPDVAGQR